MSPVIFEQTIVSSPTVFAFAFDAKLSYLPKFNLPSAIRQVEASTLDVEINPNTKIYINSFLK
jgi:hypothetical protein